MRRRYTQDEYRDAVLRLRDAIPDVAITTDVIVGFPGETDDEFEECLAFCEEMAFAGIHVFPYSQRSGTVAYKLPGQVSDAIKKQRVHRLIELAGDLSRTYRDRFVGTTAPCSGKSAATTAPGKASRTPTCALARAQTQTYPTRSQP